MEAQNIEKKSTKQLLKDIGEKLMYRPSLLDTEKYLERQSRYAEVDLMSKSISDLKEGDELIYVDLRTEPYTQMVIYPPK